MNTRVEYTDSSHSVCLSTGYGRVHLEGCQDVDLVFSSPSQLEQFISNCKQLLENWEKTIIAEGSYE